MISVVIPFYNNAHSIHRCLSSVKSQSYKDFEIILVNDCSPDWKESVKIISSFTALNITILHHEINKNGAVARNTGIKYANREYIALLDADDEWEKNHLQNLMDAITDDYDLYFSSCQVLSKNNYVLPKYDLNLSNNIGEFLFCDNGFIQTSSILIRSSVAKKCLFNENLRRHQDYDFLLKLEDKGCRFKWVNKATTIVHWETNDIDKKGGTWQFSLEWFGNYKKYMTPRCQSFFVYKNIVVRLFKTKNRIQGLNKFFQYCSFRYFKLKEVYFFICYLLFGEIKVLKWKR